MKWLTNYDLVKQIKSIIDIFSVVGSANKLIKFNGSGNGLEPSSITESPTSIILTKDLTSNSVASFDVSVSTDSLVTGYMQLTSAPTSTPTPSMVLGLNALNEVVAVPSTFFTSSQEYTQHTKTLDSLGKIDVSQLIDLSSLSSLNAGAYDIIILSNSTTFSCRFTLIISITSTILNYSITNAYSSSTVDGLWIDELSPPTISFRNTFNNPAINLGITIKFKKVISI